MLKRLLGLYRPKLLRCTAKKRPAGCGQDQPPDGTVRRSSLQALKYCRMLTVYRQQADTPAGRVLDLLSSPVVLVILAGSVYGLSRKPIAVEYHQWIADDAGLLTQETRQTLEEYNDQWNNKYTAVVAVATVDSTHGRSVEKYAAQLGKAWGLGPSDMLLLMVKGDHYYVLLGDSVNSTATDTQLNKLKNAVETDYYKNDYNRAALSFFRAADVVYAQIFQK